MRTLCERLYAKHGRNFRNRRSFPRSGICTDYTYKLGADYSENMFASEVFTSIEECFVCLTEDAWFGLQSDRFNILDFFLGKRELVGLKVFFHMAFICRAGQRQHADLHRKAKDHL